jgi:hypothetical protein
MRLPSGPGSIALLALAVCTACTSPHGLLDGTWSTPPIPSGGATVLQLQSDGTLVTGTGQDYGIVHVPADSLTIAGHYSGGSIQLTISYAKSGAGTFAGQLFNPDTLRGTWTGPPPQGPYQITFWRGHGG